MPPGDPNLPPTAGPYGQDCDTDPWEPQDSSGDASAPVMTLLPKDAVLTSVTRCFYDFQIVPGDGEWEVRTEQTATTGLDRLANALRWKSGTATPGQYCNLIGYSPTIITVTDTTGRTMHPLVPQTACGAPMGAVVDVMNSLPWTTVSTTMIRQTSTELEVTSNCPGQYKPEVALAADSSGHTMSRVDTTPQAMSICRYDLDTDPDNTVSVGGSAHSSGVLTSAGSLDAKAGGEFLAAVADAWPADDCDKPDAPFAVVAGQDGHGPTVTVELGGCYRALLDGDTMLRQLNQKTVDILLT